MHRLVSGQRSHPASPPAQRRNPRSSSLALLPTIETRSRGGPRRSARPPLPKGEGRHLPGTGLVHLRAPALCVRIPTSVPNARHSPFGTSGATDERHPRIPHGFWGPTAFASSGKNRHRRSPSVDEGGAPWPSWASAWKGCLERNLVARRFVLYAELPAEPPVTPGSTLAHALSSMRKFVVHERRRSRVRRHLTNARVRLPAPPAISEWTYDLIGRSVRTHVS